MSNFKDYKNFQKETHQAPQHLAEILKKMVHKDLTPTHMSIFTKVLGVHGLIGALTLLFCPQFGLSLTNRYEVFHYLHHTFGESLCMMICGMIFMAPGALLAAYLLKEIEIKQIQSTYFLYYPILGICSLPIFYFFGGNINIGMAFIWLIGATIGPTLAIKALRSLYYQMKLI